MTLNTFITHCFYRSIELNVKELDGKNYSLLIKNLAETIDVAKSHWKVKTGMSKSHFNPKHFLSNVF